MSKEDSESYFSGKHQDRIHEYLRSQNALALQIEKEKKVKGHYTWPFYDSPLLPRKGFNSFDQEFGLFANEGQNLKEYIEERLGHKKGDATAIEFGGTGSNLFAGFSDGFFRKTVGLTLVDKRGRVKRKRDRERSHTVISGDMSSTVVGQLRSWLDGEKADLIIERLGGGASKLPQDPYFMARQVSSWYEMTSVDGLMLLQIPQIMAPLARPWVEKVSNIQGLEVRYGLKPYSLWEDIEIRKGTLAPKQLPLLTPRETRNAYESELYP